MKWLKRIILKWDLYKLRHELQQASPYKAERQLCLKLLELIPDDCLTQPDGVDLFSLFVQTQFTDLDSLIAKTKESIRLIKEQKIIASDWLSAPQASLTLGQFITTSNGFYVMPAASIRSFKQTAITLCELMLPSDTETVGLPEHNLRMLTKLFIEIRMLSLLLLEVSSAF